MPMILSLCSRSAHGLRAALSWFPYTQGRWGSFTTAEEVEALIDSLDRWGAGLLATQSQRSMDCCVVLVLGVCRLPLALLAQLHCLPPGPWPCLPHYQGPLWASPACSAQRAGCAPSRGNMLRPAALHDHNEYQGRPEKCPHCALLRRQYNLSI
jgi:hypothetical protein